jgi:hypothetical protein
MTTALSLLALIIMLPLAVIYLPGHKNRLEKIFVIPAFEAVDFATLRKTSKPNQYLVCPADICVETPDMQPRLYPITATALAAAWQQVIAAEADVTEHGRNDGVAMIDYVQRTPRMRYPDLITVRFIPRDNEQSTIAIYSRSVYGHGDLGANKKRISHWLSKLDQTISG